MLKKLLIIALMSAPLYSQVPVGSAGAKFLSISVTPRASGMGDAFVAVANDPSSIFWNPAGIAHLRQFAFFTSYSNWIADGRVPAFAVIFPKYPIGTFSVFASGIYMGGFEGVAFDENHNIVETGTFSYSAMQLGFGVSRFYTDKFAAGVAVKFIDENLGNVTSAYSVAIDAGTYFYTGFKDIRVAMSLQNLGADMSPKGEYDLWIMKGSQVTTEKRKYQSYSLPLTFRLGLARDFIKNGNKIKRLTGSVEIINPKDNRESFAIGFEMQPVEILTLRAGYHFNLDEGGFGAGASFNLGNKRFDISYNDFGHLPDVVRLGIVFAK